MEGKQDGKRIFNCILHHWNQSWTLEDFKILGWYQVDIAVKMNGWRSIWCIYMNCFVDCSTVCTSILILFFVLANECCYHIDAEYKKNKIQQQQMRKKKKRFAYHHIQHLMLNYC